MIKRTKRLSMAALALGMALLISACQTSKTRIGLQEQKKDRESYSLGYQTGQGLKSRKVDIKVDAYISGIRAAVDGKESEFTREEMQVALTELAKRATAAKQEQEKAKAEENLAAGRAFLEENKKREGVKTLPSGLQYKVIQDGKGRSPSANDTVTVNYRALFINGVEFAGSARQGKPTTASLNRVIPGWLEALQLMKEGARWQLFVPSNLAYGEKGARGVEPNSTLIFDVALISVNPAVAGNMRGSSSTRNVSDSRPLYHSRVYQDR